LRQCSKDLTMISQKTSFNCDTCSMVWNSKGTSVLVTATTDVDKSDKSYYGVSHLYVLSTNTENFKVDLDKEGPLHYLEWNPNGKEFCVCYGFMPSKISVFNIRGDVTWQMGEGHRNEVHYNRFGNILLTCGFGNLSAGKMQFWNVDQKKEIVSIEVPNTTLFQWAPDGQHFLTATTAPRLRIDNCYRIWHYSGKLISEKLWGNTELWQVIWKPVAGGIYSRFKVPELTAQEKANSGLLIKQSKNATGVDALPAGAITKAGAYVPPHLRKNGSTKGALSKPTDAPPKPQVNETAKKIKQVQKKLEDIEKLRQRKENGDVLEVNQLAKIEKEGELIAELDSLRLLEESTA
jgi:translation initiation factor 2A